MDELRDRFAALDSVPVPDLWPDIGRRAGTAGASPRARGQVVWRAERAPYRVRPTAMLLLLGLLLALALAFITVGSRLPNLWTSVLPSPTAEADVVMGWPGNTGRNEPGLYSWDGSTCEPTNCIMGVLHKHDSKPQVRISIHRISERTISDASAMPVTVAGHQGLYQRINPQLEEWNVDFDGTLLSISLSVEGGASQTDVDEANSIVESLVYEQWDTPLGFRLVFRLPSRHWDSPY